MSRLNFSSIDEAFILSSNQIKNTQEEIANLKALVLESNGIVSQKKELKPPPPITTPNVETTHFGEITTPKGEYKRMGPQPINAYPSPSSEDDFDY